MEASTLSPHGDGSTWRWSEGQNRWTSLPSPQIMPNAELIDERGSFLEPIKSFQLDSEPASTMDSPLRAGPIPPTRVPSAGLPLAREHSAELSHTIQSAFDEMDAALASRPPQHLPVMRVSASPMGVHPTPLNVFAPAYVPFALRGATSARQKVKATEAFPVPFDSRPASSRGRPAQGAPARAAPRGPILGGSI